MKVAIDRREFLKGLLAGTGAVIVAPVPATILPPEPAKRIWQVGVDLRRPQIIFPVIRRVVFPSFIAREVVAVQPMIPLPPETLFYKSFS